jgi:hypothetical protein
MVALCRLEYHDMPEEKVEAHPSSSGKRMFASVQGFLFLMRGKKNDLWIGSHMVHR